MGAPAFTLKNVNAGPNISLKKRLTPDNVKEFLFKNLSAIAPSRGYILGASIQCPSISPKYNAMRETALEYGQYPISL